MRVRNPMEGQLVRRSRCKLAGKGAVILDSLTREERAWQGRLRGAFKEAKEQGESHQRARSASL